MTASSSYGDDLTGDDVLDAIRGLIRDVPDFPKAGIVFRDITPVLGDATAFRGMIAAMAEPFRDARIDRVVGIEARGFLLGAPLAVELGVGFAPVRKAGKLPSETFAADFELEYAEATIEMHRDALGAGDRVLVVDDVLATGGTLEAAVELVGRSGAVVTGIVVLIELTALDGRSAAGRIRRNVAHPVLATPDPVGNPHPNPLPEGRGGSCEGQGARFAPVRERRGLRENDRGANAASGGNHPDILLVGEAVIVARPHKVQIRSAGWPSALRRRQPERTAINRDNRMPGRIRKTVC